MNSCLFANGAWIAAFLACASCSDDPELAAKRELQQTEIIRLQGEITLAQKRLENLPEDNASQLKAAEKQLHDLALEANRLEAEVAEIRESKVDLEKEFARYKDKYPIN